MRQSRHLYRPPTGTDNCPSVTTTQTAGLPSGATFPVGTTTNTFRVTDASSNTATCTFTVTITDTQSPTLVACPANITVFTSNGTCDANVNWTAPTANDNCSISSLTNTHAPGSLFAIGTTTVTYTATDASNNTATCAFTVMVADNQSPSITCPANVTASTNAFDCNANATWTPPTASDNCTVASTISTHAPGSTFPFGLTTVTYTATDGNSNTATCTFTVTITDNTPPTAICHNTTVALDTLGNGTTTAAAIDSASTDACGIDSLSLDITAFTCANAGANTVILTVTDLSGNTSTCTATVTVTATPVIAVANADLADCGFNITCANASDGVAHATATGGCPSYTYLWNIGDTTATITGLPPGTYTVTITDGTGTSAIDSVTITAPTALEVTQFTVVATCANDSAGSADITVGGGNDCHAYTYLWTNGDTTQDLSNVAGGVYTVTVTDAQACILTQQITIGILPLPSPTFAQVGNTLVSNQTWATYQWLLNDTTILGENNPSIELTISGDYSLFVTDSNGCQGTSASSPIVGLSDARGELSDLSLFPNPARDVFYLRTAAPIASRLTVTLFDMYGHQLESKIHDHLSQDTPFDIKAYPAGTYILQIQTESGQHRSFRLVVQ